MSIKEKIKTHYESIAIFIITIFFFLFSQIKLSFFYSICKLFSKNGGEKKFIVGGTPKVSIKTQTVIIRSTNTLVWIQLLKDDNKEGWVKSGPVKKFLKYYIFRLIVGGNPSS